VRILIASILFKEGEHIVSLCPQLNVSSFGETAEEAKKSLVEAVTLFLQECQKMGTLEEVLEEAGYSRRGEEWIPPQIIASEQFEVAVA